MVDRVRFGCPSCGAPFTPPLRRLPAFLADAPPHDLCMETPRGTFAFRPVPYGRPHHPIAIAIEDARALVPHEDVRRSVGCCGVGYRENLPNLRCARCGHEAAYRLSDGDHVAHAIYLADVRVETIARDEPDDDALRARFEARRRETPRLPEDAGFGALPARLRVSADALWDEDRQDPALFPELRDLGMAASGLDLRLALDGVWVRPPWPEGERHRALALATLPRGLPDDPLYWWLDEPRDRRARPAWWQWHVDDELCIAWQRGDDTRAFRVPVDLWELAFREAVGA